MPAIPSLLLIAAAIMPATNVPCPSSSVNGLPPTKLRASEILFLKSGWPPSMPESTIATLTGARSGSSPGKLSNARSCARYHWRYARGSLGVKLDRSDRHLDGGRRHLLRREPVLGRDDGLHQHAERPVLRRLQLGGGLPHTLDTLLQRHGGQSTGQAV